MSNTSSDECTAKEKTKIEVSDVNKHINGEEKLEFNSGTGKPSETSFDPNSPFSETSSLTLSIEQEILGINENNVDQVFNRIKENITMFNFATGFIDYALKISPNQTENLISLLSKLSEIHKYTPSRNLIEEHRDILIKRGIIKGKSDYHEKVKLFEEGSVEEAIKEDSVDKLIKISAQHDFNPKGTLKINRNQSLYFVTEDPDDFEGIEVTYMQLMAYFGSVKCFKYALIDGSFDDNGISEYAVAGGNLEIIHLLEQKGVSFDGCFEVSVKFNRYEISEWLFRNYECKIALRKTCEYYNYRMFLFCIQNKIDFTKDSINESLISSAVTGHIDLVKYLIEHCHADVETKDENGRTPLNTASKEGHIDLVKYLVEHCHADVETKDKYEKTLLHRASEDGQIEVVKYLVEHCHADVETKDDCRMTPIIMASCEGHIEVVKYLFEHCHADVETKDRFGWAPLNSASFTGQIDLVKYLIEHCHADVETKNRFGWTPLNSASFNGHIEVVKYLIEKGAKVTEKDLEPETTGEIKRILREHIN